VDPALTRLVQPAALSYRRTGSLPDTSDRRIAWAAPSSRFTLDWRTLSHIVARVVDRKLDR
jgi:hypothetical protein